MYLQIILTIVLVIEVALLDVGSGPFSRVPRNINGRNINITPVDPLAKKYNKIIDKSDVDYPFLKIIEGTGESLAEQFSENSFDIVFSYNALDHFNESIEVY